MIWGWENPWFFTLGGSAVILLLIYLLKYRGKVFFTQALFLWEEKGAAEKSSVGLTLRKLPLSFFLELLALICMICGGAFLFVVEKEKFPPAVILLNDSYSMNAAARTRGAAAVKKYLEQFPGRRVFWVLCGSGTGVLNKGESAFEFTEHWKGEEPECNVPRAVSWAKKNFPGAEICLVTDRVPPEWSADEMTLLCCGIPGKNLAIVNGAVKEGRVLLEIYNFSDSEMKALLKVNSVFLERFTVSGNGRKLFNFTLDRSGGILHFTLEAPGDALEYDNKITLVDPLEKKVTYTFGQLSPGEKKSLETVLAGNPEFRPVPEDAELLFTQYTNKKVSYSGHRVFFHRGGKSFYARRPPFFMPREQLLAGLTNTSLVWAFSPELHLPGRGVIFSGETTLMSVEQRKNGKMDIHLNLVPEHSNLFRLPFWPGFFCNLASLCRLSRPGVAEPNVRSGEMFSFNTSRGAEKLHFRCGTLTGEVNAAGEKCVLQLKKCGLYTLSDGKVESSVAVNPQVTAVSDLRKNRSLLLPCKKSPQGAERRSSKSWVFISLALGVLTLNHFLCSRSRP